MAPDVSYGFDCCISLLDMSGDTHYYFNRYHQDVNAWYDGLERFDGNFLEIFPREAARVYDGWFYKELPDLDRCATLLSGIETFPSMFHECLLGACNDLIGSSLTDAQILKEASHKKHVLNNRAYLQYVGLWNKLAQKIESVDIGMLRDSIAYREENERFERMTFEQAWESEREQIIISARTQPRRIFTVSDKMKKILRKSTDILRGLIGDEQTRMFVSGKEISVTGKQYVFKVTKGNLTRDSHGAVNVSVEHKKTKKQLLKLCWYIENTPAPEQLAGLVMHVAAGNEQEIIKTANWIKTTDDARKNKKLMQLKEIRPREREIIHLADIDVGEITEIVDRISPGSGRINRLQPLIKETMRKNLFKNFPKQLTMLNKTPMLVNQINLLGSK